MTVCALYDTHIHTEFAVVKHLYYLVNTCLHKKNVLHYYKTIEKKPH